MPPLDVHAHFLPSDVFRDIYAKYGSQDIQFSLTDDSLTFRYSDTSYFGKVDPNFATEEGMIESLDRQKLKKRLLSIFPNALPLSLEHEALSQLMKDINNRLGEMTGRHPDRLGGLATVPMHKPEEAAEELRRTVKDLGFVGALVGSNVNGKNLDDPSLSPFFAEVERLGVPIFIHPMAPRAGGARISRFQLGNIIGNPLETTIAAGSLIFGGVLQRYKGLKIVLVHGGGFLPYQFGRFDWAYHARPEIGALIPKQPSAYMENFYFDTILHDAPSLEYMISKVGASHVVLGSDYPFDMGYPDPVGVVTSLKLPPDAEEAILSANAERIFHL